MGRRAKVILLILAAIASCKSDSVTGLPDASSIVVTSPRTSILVGDSTQAVATALGETGSAISAYPVTWTSSDTSIATVSSSGLVRGKNPGDVMITASGGGVSGSTTIKIMPVPVKSLAITPAAPAVVAGDSVKLAIQVLDSAGNQLSGRTVSWISETPAIATISTTGVVQTLRPGQAVIRATVEGVTRTATITATTGPVQSIQISPSLQILYAGGSEASTATGVFVVTATDARGFTIPNSLLSLTWQSEDPAKAQVTQTGTPYGISESPGVRVFASSNGVKGEATVRVVKVASMTAGRDHACFLTTTGSVWCWGTNRQSQLGRGYEGGFTSFPNPVVSQPPFSSFDAGANTTCGLTSDGTAYCWGVNERGELGDSSSVISRAVPAPVKTSVKFLQVSVGNVHTCAIAVDTQLYCWGNLLPEPANIRAPVPRLVNTPVRFKQIEVGYYNQCGIDENEDAWCWGYNDWGQLGIGSVGTVSQPTRVLGGLKFKQVVPSLTVTCGITTAEQLYCWGQEICGQCNPRAITTPQPVAASIRFRSISMWGASACGVTPDGAAYCLGGAPGDGSIFNAGFVRVKPPGDLTDATYVQAVSGDGYRCVLTLEGLPSCWGTEGATGRSADTFSPHPLSRPLLTPETF